MEWSLENIIQECNRLSSLKKDTFSIPVYLNNRLTKTLGRVVYIANKNKEITSIKCMEISTRFLTYGSYEEVKKVIAHEWSHYYLNKTTKVSHGHDSMFNRLAEEMGGNTGRSIEIKDLPKKEYKYNVYCSKCGELIAQYYRAGKFVQHPELAKSKCCNSSIIVKENH